MKGDPTTGCRHDLIESVMNGSDRHEQATARTLVYVADYRDHSPTPHWGEEGHLEFEALLLTTTVQSLVQTWNYCSQYRLTPL